MTAVHQTDRVLAVLKQRPTTIIDWDCQPACDGMPRILRLGARINDLKRRGFPVSSRLVMVGGVRVAEYRLAGVPAQMVAAGSETTTSRSPGEGGEAATNSFRSHVPEQGRKTGRCGVVGTTAGGSLPSASRRTVSDSSQLRLEMAA